jgi:hypothetical protein
MVSAPRQAASKRVRRVSLAALGNGVKGRKWVSLIDKVFRSFFVIPFSTHGVGLHT